MSEHVRVCCHHHRGRRLGCARAQQHSHFTSSTSSPAPGTRRAAATSPSLRRSTRHSAPPHAATPRTRAFAAPRCDALLLVLLPLLLLALLVGLQRSALTQPRIARSRAPRARKRSCWGCWIPPLQCMPRLHFAPRAPVRRCSQGHCARPSPRSTFSSHPRSWSRVSLARRYLASRRRWCHLQSWSGPCRRWSTARRALLISATRRRIQPLVPPRQEQDQWPRARPRSRSHVRPEWIHA